MKYFRMSYHEVVFERSYLNLLLLNRAIPGMKPFDKEDTDTKGSTKLVRRENKPMHANSFFEQLM